MSLSPSGKNKNINFLKQQEEDQDSKHGFLQSYNSPMEKDNVAFPILSKRPQIKKELASTVKLPKFQTNPSSQNPPAAAISSLERRESPIK